jgi:hypothetical protein
MSAEHDDELWFVELPDGRTRAMTLEELDGAYQAGEISETTRVRKDGSSEWSTLAVVAGLEEDDAFAETIPSASPPSGPHSLSPQMISSPPPPVAFEVAPTEQQRAVHADFALDDVPDDALKKSKKPIVFGLVGIAAVAAIVVVGLTRAGADAAEKALPAAAAAAAMAPPAAVDPTPAPATAAAPKLNDDQRKALAEQDKKRDAENQRKAKDRAERASQQQVRRTRGKSNEPFVKGTSKYDPLNGAL